MNKFQHAGAGVPLALAALFCFSAAPATAANITIVNSSCTAFTTSTDASGNLTVNCETTSPTPGVPSCSSLTASPSSLSAAGLVALTANCTGAAKYDWSASPSAVLTSTTDGNTQSVNISATTTFSVTPVALDGTRGSSYSRTVSVQATPPSPPPTGTISCPGYAGTAVLDATVPVNGAANATYYPSAYKSWAGQGALVVRFTAPPADSAFQFAFAPYGSGLDAFHNYTVASEPCVFDPAAPSAMGGLTSTKTTFTVYLSSNGKPHAYASYIKSLTPGQTYYINAAHKSGGNWSCSTATCDMIITVTNK
jgi:hypothetical protein